ncbi:MAG TPA: hypothetical protein VID48_00300 [Solirubrobacteraceae bacterium]
MPDTVYRLVAASFTSSELANLIIAISAIDSWNRIAISSAMSFTEN